MKRISAILVLLLAISVVAGSVSPPAACAVSASGTGSGLQVSCGTTSPATAGGSSPGTTDVTGDPGGAGDGLGATPVMQGLDAAKNVGAGAVVEFVLQLLRLMQAAG
jgi:hypothetical protein